MRWRGGHGPLILDASVLIGLLDRAEAHHGPLTASIAERAAELRARHQRLRMPNAVVLACAHKGQGALPTYDGSLNRLARES